MELLKGLEPPTYALQVRCTTYCATAAYSIVFSHSYGLTKLLMFDNQIERYFNHTTLAPKITSDFKLRYI